jgi:hypothetical protein
MDGKKRIVRRFLDVTEGRRVEFAKVEGMPSVSYNAAELFNAVGKVFWSSATKMGADVPYITAEPETLPFQHQN